jgi:hypothetical protein
LIHYVDSRILLPFTATDLQIATYASGWRLDGVTERNPTTTYVRYGNLNIFGPFGVVAFRDISTSSSDSDASKDLSLSYSVSQEDATLDSGLVCSGSILEVSMLSKSTPVSGVAVRLIDASTGSKIGDDQLTDSEGMVSFTLDQNGTYQITNPVKKSGYQKAFSSAFEATILCNSALLEPVELPEDTEPTDEEPGSSTTEPTEPTEEPEEPTTTGPDSEPEPTPTETPEPVPTPDAGGDNGLLLGIVVVAALALAAIYFFMMRGGGSKAYKGFKR